MDLITLLHTGAWRTPADAKSTLMIRDEQGRELRPSRPDVHNQKVVSGQRSSRGTIRLALSAKRLMLCL